jgi:hypothetical protein
MFLERRRKEIENGTSHRHQPLNLIQEAIRVYLTKTNETKEPKKVKVGLRSFHSLTAQRAELWTWVWDSLNTI